MQDTQYTIYINNKRYNILWGKESEDQVQKILYLPSLSYRIATNAYCNGIGTVTDPYIVIPLKTYDGIPVVGIDESAFKNNSDLKEVVISNNVTTIGDFAFYNCSGLTSVALPDSTKKIGAHAFDGCDNLSFVTYSNTKYLSSADNPYFACIKPSSQDYSSYTIHKDTEVIAAAAFLNCSRLTSLTIPSFVTSIDDYVFQNCSSLTSITIPDSVTEIGMHAFDGCSSLSNIIIPDNVTNIDYYAFQNCSGLTRVTIGSKVDSIRGWAFTGCRSLTSLTFCNDKTVVRSNAFAGCPIENVTIPTSNGASVLSYIPQSDLKKVKLPSGTNIVDRAFEGRASLTSIEIPDSIALIGEAAFKGCTFLTSMTIPATVTSIGSDAFNGCTMLETLIFKGPKIKWDNILKGQDWCNGVKTTKVTCSDGTVNL
jgi:hypothetical protein